jgi:hypothetical protein
VVHITSILQLIHKSGMECSLFAAVVHVTPSPMLRIIVRILLGLLSRSMADMSKFVAVVGLVGDYVVARGVMGVIR